MTGVPNGSETGWVLLIAPCYTSRCSHTLSPSLPAVAAYTPYIRTDRCGGVSVHVRIYPAHKERRSSKPRLPNHALPVRYRRLARSVRKLDASSRFASCSQPEITCARRNCPSIGASRRAALGRSSASRRETVPKLLLGTKEVCACILRAWFVLHPSRSLSQDRDGFSQLFLREMGSLCLFCFVCQ